ncbi:unnamed protein product [Amoebophrya sp. A120]|nr:unnamed protein product [Amoebophrya sp. A120]|eukprot:GSA120T00015113001.1
MTSSSASCRTFSLSLTGHLGRHGSPPPAALMSSGLVAVTNNAKDADFTQSAVEHLMHDRIMDAQQWIRGSPSRRSFALTRQQNSSPSPRPRGEQIPTSCSTQQQLENNPAVRSTLAPQRRRKNMGRPMGKGAYLRYRPQSRGRTSGSFGTLHDPHPEATCHDKQMTRLLQARQRRLKFLEVQNELLRHENHRLHAHPPVTDFALRCGRDYETSALSDRVLRAWVARPDDALFATEKNLLHERYYQQPKGDYRKRRGLAPDFDKMHARDRRRKAEAKKQHEIWRDTTIAGGGPPRNELNLNQGKSSKVVKRKFTVDQLPVYLQAPELMQYVCCD